MNIFQRIIAKEFPATILYEDDRCMAFEDVNPQAPVHVLVVPKKDICSVNEIAPEDADLIGHIFCVIRKVAADKELTDSGYRIVSNCGPDAGQTVPHLHFHILGGRPLTWPPG